MAAEYDFASGFDFSSLSSITGAQLQQTVNGISPLSNKGLVYYGSVAPDVVNNARYARYIWVDTSAAPYVAKLWSGAAWVTIAPGAGGITEAMIAVASVSLLDDDGVTYKITRAFNDANDVTKARYLLWLDANGKRVEIGSLASVLATGSGTIAGIAGLDVGLDNQILRMNGASINWETVNFASDIADGSVALAKLASGAANQLIRCDGSGIPTYVSTINILTAMEQGAAGALQEVRRNAANTAWEYHTPKFSKEMVEVTAAATLADGAFPHAHGLGAILPKKVEVVLVCVLNEAATGYTAGDEVDCPIVNPVADVAGASYFSTARDTTNITVLINNTANMQVRHKATGVYTTITAATNWKYRVRAWA